MRYALIAFTLLLAGCEDGGPFDNRLIYRQTIKNTLVHTERLKIQRDLEMDGWTDVQFIYGDNDTDIVTARKRRDAK